MIMAAALRSLVLYTASVVCDSCVSVEWCWQYADCVGLRVDYLVIRLNAAITRSVLVSRF